ncbi:MAG TPA: class I SAM-dependent methyltransferase [Candidatus Saccharimonadales bacterium]|nr:class I SAM-dependent methyltransferase [Candidatus Saccharimonadales bacterium]
MKNQKDFWKVNHTKLLGGYSDHHTTYAEEVVRTFPSHARVLDLGTGEGNDAFYFAENGHTVVATDFLPELLTIGKSRYSHKNLTFLEQDISQPLKFATNEFDVVYARLSLHYFTNATTRGIFTEIARVLKPGGKFCFMCKSPDDRRYGQGVQIEPDMFDYNGHIRHFFSEDYARSLLAKDFTTELLQAGKEQLYAEVSAFTKVIATKK